MITYDKAATCIYEYVESEIKTFKHGLKSSNDVYQAISGYVKAMADTGLCGEGYAANVLNYASEILFK